LFIGRGVTASVAENDENEAIASANNAKIVIEIFR
jgi:hypothetical protein